MRIEYSGKVPEEEVISGSSAVSVALRWKVDVSGRSEAKNNRLYYGENLSVLRLLLEDSDVRGKVRMVYIDPPFATGRAFATRDGKAAYTDALIGGEFLEFLRQRLILIRELLTDDGSIYVHIDSTIGHYVKIIMDEVFGASCFRNDISRIKCNPKNFGRRAYGNIKDTILFYSRNPATGDSPLFNDRRTLLSEEEIEKQFPKTDVLGRRYATTPLHAPGETRNGPTGEVWRGMKPPVGRHWRYPPDELEKLDLAGLLEWSSTGNPRKIIYADENRGRKVQDVWEYKDKGAERASYPTEKNMNLLRYIVSNSSAEGDLVLDAFAGSGTTLVAADQLRRRWIGIDASPLGISVCQTRLTMPDRDEGTLSGFSLYQADLSPQPLTESCNLDWKVSEPDSLLDGDLNIELDLGEDSEISLSDKVSRILVDPDYDEAGIPDFQKSVVTEPGTDGRVKISLDSSSVGENVLLLMLHETGKESLKLLKLKTSAVG